MRHRDSFGKRTAYGRMRHVAESMATYRRNRAAIDVIKLERGCEWVRPDGSVCGFREHASALEFDHRDPMTKRFIISDRLTHRWSDVMAEIAKCDVLCANHHRMRTVDERHGQVRRSVDLPKVDDPQMSLFDEEAA